MITDKALIKVFFDTYDWREAISYAHWKVEDVDQIIAYAEGDNDGPNWLVVVHLKPYWSPVNEYRYSFLSAGCDFTGWDCQASGHSTEKATLKELIRFGMGQDDRDRLGLSIEGRKTTYRSL